jgi:ABC-2 type transport system permease protein
MSQHPTTLDPHEPAEGLAPPAPSRRPRTRSPFWAIAVAIVKGFARDRAAVFFALVFPLMFLVLFGGIFNLDSTSRLDVIQVGDVPLVDSLPPGAREAFDDTFEVSRSDDLDTALAEVRKGDADAVIVMRGNTLVAHYTQTDQVKAAMTQGALRAFVDGANVAAAGGPPQFDFRAEPVEDESLEAIQFVTPGLLGWAIAMSASFGAAATLQGWRQSKLMRRLQLSPVPARTIVGARVLVTVLVALVQMTIFLGLGFFAFGLQLTGWWWMSVPLLVVGTLCFMSLGLLAGAVAKSTEGAVNMANFLVLPMAFLSGSFFPLDAAPAWLQNISLALPLRHLNEGMLDLMVRDAGPSAVVVPMAILTAFTLVMTGLAARLFRWDAD